VRRVALAVLLVALVPGAAADARTTKSLGPVSLAAGYGAAWVGCGDGRVVRIDVRTRERRTTRLGLASVTSLVAAFGSVWASPSSGPLHRLDPATGRLVAIVRDQPGRWSGGSAIAAATPYALWVGDYQRDAVFRVDPRTNRVTRRRALPHRLRSISAGPAGVWLQTIPGRGPVTGPDGPRIVSRIGPRTLRMRRAFRLGCDASLQPHGRALWVLDQCHGHLRRFDPRTREFGPLIETSLNAATVGSGFGSIWVADGTTVHRIRGNRVVARIPAAGQALAAGERLLWVLDHGDGVTGFLRRIDPRTNRVVGRPIRLGAT
jgi:streptogramin lyase